MFTLPTPWRMLFTTSSERHRYRGSSRDPLWQSTDPASTKRACLDLQREDASGERRTLSTPVATSVGRSPHHLALRTYVFC